MIGLALRIVLGDGRSGRASLGLAVAGASLAVACILSVAAIPHAVQQRAARVAWRYADASGAEAPVVVEAQVGDRGFEVVVVPIAPEGAARVPGLPVALRAGETALSPSLGRLAAALPPDQLDGRFTGSRSVPPDARSLMWPGELVAYVGADESVVRGLRGRVAQRDRSSEHTGTAAIGMIAWVMTMPFLMFTHLALGLRAARRYRTAAQLELLGAGARDISLITCVEALVILLPGAVVGLLIQRALAGVLATVPVLGAPFVASDLRMSALSSAALALLLVLAATGTEWALTMLHRRRRAGRQVARTGHQPRLFDPWFGAAGLVAWRRLTAAPGGPVRAASLVAMAFASLMALEVLATGFSASPLVTGLPGGVACVVSDVGPLSEEMVASIGSTAGVRSHAAARAVRVEQAGQRFLVWAYDPALPPNESLARVIGGRAGIAYGVDLGPAAALRDLGVVMPQAVSRYPDPGLFVPDAVLPADGPVRADRVWVETDGSSGALDRLRTLAAAESLAGVRVVTQGRASDARAGLEAAGGALVHLGAALALTVAGLGLALVNVGSVLERRRSFAALRLSGADDGVLFRVLAIEALVPLGGLAVVGALAGGGAARAILTLGGGVERYSAVSGRLGVWVIVLPLVALGSAAAAMPLLRRVTRTEEMSSDE